MLKQFESNVSGESRVKSGFSWLCSKAYQSFG